MVIEIDIGDYVKVGDIDSDSPWSVVNSPIKGLDLAPSFWLFVLGGEVGEWLRERGHSGRFRVYKENDDITLVFIDPRLATLFKLTWL